MKNIIISFVLALMIKPIVLMAQKSSEQTAWTLVYEHDSLGQVLRGNKAALLQAVRAGARVRIGYQIPFRDSVVEHVFPGDQVTIFKNELYIQCQPLTSQRWDHPQLVIWFGEKPFTFYALCSTTGQCEEMAVEWQSGQKLMQRPIRRSLQWFVDQ